MLPNYIDQRIRAAVPKDLMVVPDSTPVVSFGDARMARVATLGLNPSKVEFLNNNGYLLHDDQRRLETLQSLGVRDLASAAPSVIGAVYESCIQYFRRNPYRRWFGQLERVLQRFNVSYYEGSACHLDLVQWATDPTWGKLPASIRRRLLEADAEFLWKQLTYESIELLLLNGRGVVEEFERRYSLRLTQMGTERFGKFPTTFFHGHISNTLIIGWSTNLQSTYGVTNIAREKIASRARELATFSGQVA